MDDTKARPAWWCSARLRISHPTLDPAVLSKALNAIPVVAQRPGESKVVHGDCKSAGYWCVEQQVEYPDRPDALFTWVEQFILERESHFRRMREQLYNIDVYIGIHTTVLAVGFNVPMTPTLWKLAIPLGIEFFAP
jgi:hypothetical protein